MILPAPLRSIRVRLAIIIVLAMTALVGFLVYQAIEDRSNEREQVHEDLRRLAVFAAHAERERFEATENLLSLVTGAESLRNVARDPDNREYFDACTRGLYIIDQILPGIRSTLYDTSGSVLCSSRAAERSEFSASDKLWFRTAVERQGFATGAYETHPQTGEPGLTFGVPIREPGTNEIVAYVSAQLEVTDSSKLLAGNTLPNTGRLSVIDQNGTVIHSSGYPSGQQLPWFPDIFGALNGYLDARVVEGADRTGAGVRITDNDDALVTVIVSGETDALVDPLFESLFDDLLPVAIVTLLTLVAVWLLGQQWIGRPVGALVSATGKLAAGQLGARVEVPGAVTEFDRLAAAFNEMADNRERASQAKDEFLGLVSHELKTPITTTLGNAEILRFRGNQLDPELRQEALDDIHDSALRLAAIIDNLLVLARLERGAALETEPLALMRMAQIATDQQLRRDPGRRIIVRGDNTVLALGGETYVEQVLQNLIANAIKYSPSDTTVEVVVEDDGGMAVVRVLDRGSGIEEDEREAIFQPFYRSDRTASAAAGVGIGLSVCLRLVEAMGGTLWYSDRQGGGGEFAFSLPLVPEEEGSAVPEEEPLAPVTASSVVSLKS
jgi:signal transduction histidine kinase